MEGFWFFSCDQVRPDLRKDYLIRYLLNFVIFSFLFFTARLICFKAQKEYVYGLKWSLLWANEWASPKQYTDCPTFLTFFKEIFFEKKRDIPRIFLRYYAVSFLGQTSKFIVFTKFESRDRKFFWKSTFNWWSLNLMRNDFVGSTKKSCLRSNYSLFIYRPFLW